jgi:NSS family neurotransmitter:Na+ symporter
VAVGYLYDVRNFRLYLNSLSEIKLGRWWIVALRYVTPLVLFVILVMNLRAEFIQTYGGYPRWATWIGGWGVLMLVAVCGRLMMKWSGTNPDFIQKKEKS